MAAEKPQVGVDVEFRLDFATPIRAGIVGNLRDPIDHQHIGQGQLRIARPEHFAVAAGQQLLIRI